MGAYEGLSHYFSQGILSKAVELGYSESNLLLLQGEETIFRQKYSNIYNKLMSCSRQRDNRTPFEYGRDLVASWVFEDCIIGSLRDSGLDIRHGGSDKDRQILQDGDILGTSDCIITVDGRDVPLEIMCDYTGFWTNTERIDLRNNKYQKLKDSKSLFLGFSTFDNKLIILNFTEPLRTHYIESHRPYGGKSAYSIELEKRFIHTFDIDTMTEVINNICKNM